jgi:hypothetical protein
MQLIIITSPELAAGLSAGHRSNRAVAQVLDTVKKFRLEIRRQFPAVQDPELMRYYVAEVPDETRGEAVAVALRECSGIEAAYLKPPDELPAR